MRGKLLAEPVRCQRCSSLIEVREYISGSMDIEVKHNLSSWYGEDEVLLLGDGDRSSGIVRIVQQSLKREQCYGCGLKVLWKEIEQLKRT